MTKPAKPFAAKFQKFFSPHQVARVSTKSGQHRRAYRVESWRPTLKRALMWAAGSALAIAALTPGFKALAHRSAVHNTDAYKIARYALSSGQPVLIGENVSTVDYNLISRTACTHAAFTPIINQLTCQIPDPTDPSGKKTYTVKGDWHLGGDVITSQNRRGAKIVQMLDDISPHERDTITKASPTYRGPQPSDAELLKTARNSSAMNRFNRHDM